MAQNSSISWIFATCGLVCLLLAGCVSVQTKAGLPADWQAAIAAPVGTDLSGEYSFRGEGNSVPDNRISRFLPYPDRVFFQAKQFVIRQLDAKHIEVVIQDERAQPFRFEVIPDPTTGEIRIPTFSEAWGEGGLPGVSKVDVTFIKGRDGALYAKRTNYSAGSTLGLVVPTADVVTRWCRFAPAK